MQFQVDEIWKDRLGCPYLIILLQDGNYPVVAKNLIDGSTYTYTKEGNEINATVLSDLDLVTFLGQKENYPEYFL